MNSVDGGEDRRLGRRRPPERMQPRMIAGMRRRRTRPGGDRLAGVPRAGGDRSGLLPPHHPRPGSDEREAHEETGKTPARKSCVIETLAATPKMMKPMDGGITGAMMLPDAT